MGQHSTIEWCDSTLNLQMGCDGCELWNPAAGVKHCYAGVLTERYAGREGWPASFAEPKIFAERLDAALRWPDLTGKKRPDKPWLDGMPRVIFLDDMGDTFTESLPADWLLPLVWRMERSPHLYLFLTKRPKRMREFFEFHGSVPMNFWLGTSVTSEANKGRMAELLEIRNAFLWASYEPGLGPFDFSPYLQPRSEAYRKLSKVSHGGFAIHLLAWNCGPGMIVVGGESGPGARPFDIQWARNVIGQGKSAGVPVFVKQLGAHVCSRNDTGFEGDTPHSWPTATRIGELECYQGAPLRVYLRDRKGGNPAEWPEDLRVREFAGGQVFRKMKTTVSAPPEVKP